AVAVADRVCDISYDNETQTVTVSIGSEIPSEGMMPHLVMIGPGQKKVFTTGGVVSVAVPNIRSPLVVVPRYVQIKVNVLRDIGPFRGLTPNQRMTDQQFDQWIEANDAIFLNTIPVRWKSGGPPTMVDAERGS